MIVVEEESERASKGPLIPHDHMIETLSPQRADQAPHVRILPRRVRSDHELLGSKTLQEATEVG